MQILHGISGLRSLPPGSVLSIGNFDGLHLGHRRIFQTARQLADAERSSMAVVTFEPHPMTVLRPGLAPPRLTPPPVKQPLIESFGADYLVILAPEPEVLGMTAENFWHVLRDEVRPAHMVEGSSFHFGKGAAGDVEQLAQWSAQTSVSLHVVESVHVALLNLQIVPASSSLVRFLLAYGRARDAAILLGRAYLLSGRVAKGLSRGRELGFPTANLDCGEQLIPADGVYAGRCTVGERTFPAAVSIGTMPTFDENVRQIEAHLIGFEGDLYGQTIGVELLDWLREQRKFEGVEALKAGISSDIAETLLRVDRDASRVIATECV